MRFMHIADVHLGARPDAGRAYSENRGAELWESFERAIRLCEDERLDLLLIAGDLFHRQPLLRELKDVDYLFQGLSHTQVVLIAGNHDYLKPDSFYRQFSWCPQVHPLFGEELGYVELPELGVCVYGLSYTRREIPERLYDDARPGGRQPIEILLAHGGDERHIPVDKGRLLDLGYDYVALGHIHRPAEIVKDRIRYAGSLEPTDKNDTGAHGYVLGISDRGQTRTRFVPFARREYIHLDVEVEKGMSDLAVREKVIRAVEERGTENLYKITLTGVCDPENRPDTAGMDRYGNILEVVDASRPSYDFERLMQQNADNLLGRYIERFRECPEGSIENRALFEGVRALLETRRG